MERPVAATSLQYSEIPVGGIYAFERTITNADVLAFAALTGDFNPLHVDPEFGRRSPYGGNLVHGMLAGSLFSTLVGMHCPGKNCLYFSQTLNFKGPLNPGQTVQVKGTVLEKHDSIALITLKTEILCEGKVLISGEAKVKVMENQA